MPFENTLSRKQGNNDSLKSPPPVGMGNFALLFALLTHTAGVPAYVQGLNALRTWREAAVAACLKGLKGSP